MRLADDDRARVPFALLGVLLLVGASTYAVTLSTRGPVREDRSVEAAMDRAEAAAVGTLRTAARDAARDAARAPVTAPANTSVGRVLNDSEPFRDALRLRVYVAARDGFESAAYRTRGVTARASLPATPNASALRRAKRRVGVAAVDDGASLRVTLRNVTVSARRDGRTVAREERTMNLTVATPVLALHDRTRTFERRLNREPLDGSGLGLRLTGRLYPVVWARGYAQYGGAPVANVLANRHVALSANGGVLGVQRAVFGRSDPDGRASLRRATLRTGAADLAAASGSDAASAAEAALPRPNRPEGVGGASANRSLPRFGSADAPGPERRMRVGTSATADRAFAHLLSGTDGPSLDAVTRGAYRANVSVRTAVDSKAASDAPAPDAPGDGWTLVDQDESADAEVRPGDAPTPDVGTRHAFASFERVVTVEREVTRTWRRGNETTTTDAEWTDRYRVGVAVVGEYAPGGRAPDRQTRPLYESGGPLGGPNLADLRPKALSYLDARGGPDAVARRAATGDASPAPTAVYGRRPDALRDWVVADLSRLDARVRNVSVTARAGDVAAGEANPPARLAERIRENRSVLLDAPETYDGAAIRARYEARAAYLDRVVAALDRRANRTAATNREFGETLADAANASPGRLEAMMARRDDATVPPRRRVGGDGPGRAVAMVPDGDPAYLTRAEISGSRLDGAPEGRRYRALAARNVNLFTVPYGDATDGVLSEVFGPSGTVRLRTAAKALVAANRTVVATDDTALRNRRDALRGEVTDSLGVVARAERHALRRTTDLSPGARRAVVADALSRWRGTGRRALAAANGSLAAAVGAEARERLDAPPATLDLRLRAAAADATRSDAAQVPQSPATRASTRTRTLVREGLKRAAAARLENETHRAVGKWANETLGEVPAGLPVAPVPGYWYATVNVWTVTVRGEYARFAVRSDYGGGRTGRGLTYVRDGGTATLDVDGDGSAERLGRSERVRFETRTVVAVAVPPTGTGVGDVGGNADERSAGWPCPGFAMGDAANGPARCTSVQNGK